MTYNFVFRNWKNQFKEVDLDEVVDDTCSPQDRYVYDIKDMSSKVLQLSSLWLLYVVGMRQIVLISVSFYPIKSRN